MTISLHNISVIICKKVYSDGRVYIGSEFVDRTIKFFVKPDITEVEIEKNDHRMSIDINFEEMGTRIVGEDGKISVGRPNKGKWVLLMIKEMGDKEVKK